jgi:Rod binding domain-containing protein
MQLADAASMTFSDAIGVPRATTLEAKARAVAQDFESFFISAMLETMSSGLDVDPVFGGGHGEAVYRSLLNQEYARTFARSGGIGIADTVQREIMRLQEAS